MIINLIGPPAAGKSTFAARYVLEHPFFTYCSIDAYRVEFEDEKIAWAMLFADVIHSNDVIMESTGLSWQLNDLYNKHTDTPDITVAFVGDEKELIRRLTERQHKRPIPYEYSKRDEIKSIGWTLDNLEESPVPIDLEVDTTVKDIDTVHREVSKAISETRTKNG